MAKGINNAVEAHEVAPVSLNELIHEHVRVAIQTAVHEELRAALAATRRIRGALQPLLKAPLVRPTRASNAHGASVALPSCRVCAKAATNSTRSSPARRHSGR